MNDAIRPPRDRTKRRPHNHPDAAAARTALVKQLANEEEAAFEAKTAKLRALRLAKELADGADEAAKAG